MRFPGARFAAAAIAMLAAAGASCRRPPLVGESAQDAAVPDAWTNGCTYCGFPDAGTAGQ